MKTVIVLIAVCLLAGGFFIYHDTSGPDGDAANNPSGLIESAKRRLADCRETIAKFGGVDLTEASREYLGKARQTLARLAESRPVDATIEPPADGVVQGKVEKGDTFIEILENAGSGPVMRYADAVSRVFNLKSFRAGQPYAVFTDPVTGRISRFEYEINDRSRLIVEGDEKPKARLEEIEYVTLLETCEGVIDDSLFQAVADAGESPQLALKLVELFGSEVNFIRDIREGDSFSALIEKRYREGEYRGYGRILAARFTNNGKTYEAWLFRDPQGGLNYYNSKGENLKKTLLMAPLAVTRLTSKFTKSRRHPILGGYRPHLGVDYGAPTGTPVKAVGAGTVVRRGWNGGYGNQIVVRHGSGLESMYSHLSGYARGIKPGQSVKQGQVIGFVGSTGLSTGPHLDFRLRQNGKFINPTKAINPRGAPVDPALSDQFSKVVELERAYLDGKPLPEKYVVDSIVPSAVSLPKESVQKGRRLTPRQQKLLRALQAQKRVLRKRLKALERESKKNWRSGNT